MFFLSHPFITALVDYYSFINKGIRVCVNHYWGLLAVWACASTPLSFLRVWGTQTSAEVSLLWHWCPIQLHLREKDRQKERKIEKSTIQAFIHCRVIKMNSPSKYQPWQWTLIPKKGTEKWKTPKIGKEAKWMKKTESEKQRKKYHKQENCYLFTVQASQREAMNCILQTKAFSPACHDSSLCACEPLWGMFSLSVDGGGFLLLCGSWAPLSSSHAHLNTNFIFWNLNYITEKTFNAYHYINMVDGNGR